MIFWEMFDSCGCPAGPDQSGKLRENGKAVFNVPEFFDCKPSY
jgi:hypothetical protein